MTKTKNILLIGRTGGGKSTLANVLTNTNKFGESSSTVSATKEVQIELAEIDISKDGSEKLDYQIIDTIGIGDTEMTPQGVLIKLAEMASLVKKEGLNQILFVTGGRFTKEEIETYDLLSSIIFDKEVLNYTTVVRTGFPEFEDKEACDDDREKLRKENAEIAHILGSVNIIYLDNPPLKGKKKVVEINKEIREDSRKRLITYLATCQGNYRPSNIDKLDERVRSYTTSEEKLQNKMKELEESRKQQEQEFRKKITELKEEQVKELRENRQRFEADIHKVKVDGEENLRKTKNEMEDKQRKDMTELERKNAEQARQMKEDHAREAKSIKEAGEQQMKTVQTQMQKSEQETERLRRDLESAKNNSNAETLALIAKMDADSKAREDRREDQVRRFEQTRLNLENQRITADNDREERRQQREEEREEKRRQEEAEKEEKAQEKLENIQEKLKKEEESRKYQQEQLQKRKK